MRALDWKNILMRALWTFVEGFLVALPIGVANDISGAGWKAALVSAAMAGLSAVKTFIVELIQKNNEEHKD